MFPYSDPTGGTLLAKSGALPHYQRFIHQHYRRLARTARSHFTLLEAFEQLVSGVQAGSTVVPWLAFPRAAQATAEEIDDSRFEFQEEYVEWRVEEDNSGKVMRVTFTTEFPEYYEALAAAGMTALIQGIQEVLPGSNPTVKELFGPNFDPAAASPEARAAQLRSRDLKNPWNNGSKGILYLAHPANTLGALFELVGRCAIERTDLSPTSVCANSGNACVAERNSDPVVCAAAQNLARSANGLSLADRPGVQILNLQGIWKINGQQVDINDAAQNKGAWTIIRNGRRAMLDVTKGVTIGDDKITSGAQVAARLQVGAAVVFAPESSIPTWAKTGQESSRRIT